jgi:protease IV
MLTCCKCLAPGLALAACVALAGPAPAAGPAKKDKGEKPAKTTARVAHIKLSGGMDERPPLDDPLFGSLGETFRDKLERIKKAKDDKEIQALYLEVNGASLGWAKLDELSRAVADFRKAGKKTFAYVEAGNSRDYLLAVACDDVCIPEATWLMLTGIRAEVTFYKGLFDKVGVKADFLHMGEYKSAAEPFTRESLSRPAREQLESVLDDHFQKGIVGRIVRARAGKGLTAEKLKKLIDSAPFTAKKALKEGLVDRLAYPDGYPDAMKEVLKVDEVKVARDYGKKKEEDLDIFSLYRKLLFGPSKGGGGRGPKVAVVYATGAIVTGKGGGSLLAGDLVGSDTMVKAIRQANDDKTVKAIVLRVDSPGGSALASDLIWNELRRCKKPVVASMSDVAASGGYYISMGARKIYADPGTLTGSIGVVGGKFALAGLYDKVGLKTEVIQRGAHASILSGDDPFSPSERKAMKALMQDVYDQFLDKALAGRHRAGKKMTREQLVKLAGGRVWTGRQAKDNGLIDELGTLEDAVACAWKMAGMPADKKPELLLLPRAKNPLEALLGDAFGARAAGVEARLLPLADEVPGLRAKLRGAGALLRMRGQPVFTILPYRLEVK